MAFIGIDIGTSFVKGALLDLQACRYEYVVRVPFPDHLPLNDSSRFEFDPRKILDTVGSIVGELSAADPSCEGVVMCTQMGSMALTNERGEALSNCIGWRDQRAALQHSAGSASYHEAIRERITATQRAELGNELPVGAPACFLFWLEENSLLGSGVMPVTLADFVLANLCNTRPTVDATNALAYGLLNVDIRQWHQDVIRQLGLERVHWPAIVSDGRVVGHMQLSGRNIPCYAPVGDYQCALVGAMVDSGELSLNISTGSQVSRITSHLKKGDYQSRPFFEKKFVNTISHLPAGRALNVLVDLLTEIERRTSGSVSDPGVSDPWTYIAKAVSATDHTDLEVDTSFFPGPCGTRGYISNIDERNLTVGTLFRAAFLNMADNYHRCALKIWPDCSWKNLVVSGGLGRKLPVLRDMIEQRFRSAIRLCQVEEDTLLGLMILAMVYSGKAGTLQEASQRVLELNHVVRR